MIYHKYETDRGIVIKELYDDELVTYCGTCEKEMNIDLEDISNIHEDGADFSGTTFYCVNCS